MYCVGVPSYYGSNPGFPANRSNEKFLCTCSQGDIIIVNTPTDYIMYVTPWSTGSDNHGDYGMECCNVTPLEGTILLDSALGSPKNPEGSKHSKGFTGYYLAG